MTYSGGGETCYVNRKSSTNIIRRSVMGKILRGSRNGNGPANTHIIFVERRLAGSGAGALLLIIVAGLGGFKVAKPFQTSRSCPGAVKPLHGATTAVSVQPQPAETAHRPPLKAVDKADADEFLYQPS
jgi:hypothetical protein